VGGGGGGGGGGGVAKGGKKRGNAMERERNYEVRRNVLGAQKKDGTGGSLQRDSVGDHENFRAGAKA